MSRSLNVLKGAALAVALVVAAAAGRADAASGGALDPNVTGMDHSRLDHGVLGPEPARRAVVRVASAANDPNVTGMDHSKLDHGVLGPERAPIAVAPLGRVEPAPRHDDPKPASPLPSGGTDAHLAAALTHLGNALDSAHIGDSDGLARHAEEALRHAEMSSKAAPNAHTTQVIEHLAAAVDAGKKGDLAAARKHAEEALVHLQEARK